MAVITGVEKSNSDPILPNELPPDTNLPDSNGSISAAVTSVFNNSSPSPTPLIGRVQIKEDTGFDADVDSDSGDNNVENRHSQAVSTTIKPPTKSAHQDQIQIQGISHPNNFHIYTHTDGKRYRVSITRYYENGTVCQLGKNESEWQKFDPIVKALLSDGNHIPTGEEITTYKFNPKSDQILDRNDREVSLNKKEEILDIYKNKILKTSFSEVKITSNSPEKKKKSDTAVKTTKTPKKLPPSNSSQSLLSKNSVSKPFKLQSNNSSFNMSEAIEDWSDKKKTISAQNLVLGLDALNKNLGNKFDLHVPENGGVYLFEGQIQGSRLKELRLPQFSGEKQKPVVIPLNPSGHFCGLIIDPTKRKIIYYDSKKGGLESADRLNEINEFIQANQDVLKDYTLDKKCSYNSDTIADQNEEDTIHCAAWLTRFIEQYFTNDQQRGLIVNHMENYRDSIVKLIGFHHSTIQHNHPGLSTPGNNKQPTSQISSTNPSNNEPKKKKRKVQPNSKPGNASTHSNESSNPVAPPPSSPQTKPSTHPTQNSNSSGAAQRSNSFFNWLPAFSNPFHTTNSIKPEPPKISRKSIELNNYKSLDKIVPSENYNYDHRKNQIIEDLKRGCSFIIKQNIKETIYNLHKQIESRRKSGNKEEERKHSSELQSNANACINAFNNDLQILIKKDNINLAIDLSDQGAVEPAILALQKEIEPKIENLVPGQYLWGAKKPESDKDNLDLNKRFKTVYEINEDGTVFLSSNLFIVLSGIDGNGEQRPIFEYKVSFQIHIKNGQGELDLTCTLEKVLDPTFATLTD